MSDLSQDMVSYQVLAFVGDERGYVDPEAEAMTQFGPFPKAEAERIAIRLNLAGTAALYCRWRKPERITWELMRHFIGREDED
jgi:hypothetical protein